MYNPEYIIIVHHSSFVIHYAHIIPVARRAASLEPATLCAVTGYRQPFVKPFAKPFVKLKPFEDTRGTTRGAYNIHNIMWKAD